MEGGSVPSQAIEGPGRFLPRSEMGQVSPISSPDTTLKTNLTLLLLTVTAAIY